MAERQSAVELKVGAFVLATVLVLAIGILWVLGTLPLGRQANPYTVLMGTAAGVRKGDRVRVSGIETGRVEKVSLRPGEEWPVLFEITLDSSISVTEMASAYITSDGLLSSNYLEIDPGPPSAAVLPPGGAIQGTEGAGLMQALGGLEDLSDQTSGLLAKLGGLVDDLSTSVDPLLGRLERLLSDDNMDSFSATLVAMQRLAEDTRPRTNALLERLDTLAAQLSEGTEDLPRIAANLDGMLVELRNALGTDGARLAELLESAQSTMDSAGTTMEVTARNRQRLELTLHDLQMTMANLRGFTETLEAKPSALVWKNRQPDRKPGEGQP